MFSTHDSLLQTLQVLFGLLMALMQESDRNNQTLVTQKTKDYRVMQCADGSGLFQTHLRELLQPLALGAVLTLQPLKVGANLSQLQLQLGVTTGRNEARQQKLR